MENLNCVNVFALGLSIEATNLPRAKIKHSHRMYECFIEMTTC